MTLEMVIRLSAFLAVFGLMAGWEGIAPRRHLATSKLNRWIANLAVVVINAAALRLLFSAGAIGTAIVASDQQWGLLHQVGWPTWIELILAVVALDLALYLQHVMFHAVPLLWRFHMMHHADMDCDVTTGLRFHPVEVTLSMFIKLAAIAVLGPSPQAVLAFEVLLNATSMFNHGNVRMPTSVDRVLRWLLVTPDMHRVHHSTRPEETNTNFGFNLPWWDRLLGTYRAQPVDGHESMTLGLEQFRDPARLTLTGILLLPFIGSPGDYPLSHAP
jgi:sterol desaturase/sphingolipid hydroxylase (fatty acid hydroxylase superfamily)